MLIRKQDRKGLINLDHSILVQIYDMSEWSEESAFNITAGGCILGTYTTEEKAIKVLDMIEEIYLSRMELTGGFDIANDCYVPPNFWVLPKVFQMPQDSEVQPCRK